MGLALIAVGWAEFYFCVEAPNRRESEAAEKLRSTKARTISDLNLDLVWIAPGSFLMGTPEQRMVVKWFYAAREKLANQPNPEAGFDNERAATLVTLTQPFWLGRTVSAATQNRPVMAT